MTQRNVLLCAFALTSLLTFAGCQTAPVAEPKRDVAADIKAINALSDQYAAAVNSGDAAALAATFADDGIELAPNQPAAEGRQAIQALEVTAFNESKFKFSFTQLETEVVGDWAWDRGDYTVTVTPKSGKPMEESGKYVDIVKRQPDGSWKFYRSIWNSNAPPPAAAGKKK